MLGILVALALMGVGQDGPARALTPGGPADYGSGATVQTDWYTPGGLGGGVGVFVGHPNTLTRSDRALVRFDLGRYLRFPAASLPIRQARFLFRVEAIHGAEEVRQLEVSTLGRDAAVLAGPDLVNTDARPQGTVTVRRGRAPDEACVVDVTRAVAEGLARGNRWITLRLRDVGAEAKGNPEIRPTGVVIYLRGVLPSLEIRESAR